MEGVGGTHRGERNSDAGMGAQNEDTEGWGWGHGESEAQRKG